MLRAARTLTPLLTASVITFAGLTVVASPAQAATVTDTIDGITYTADDADVAAGATATAHAAGAPTVSIPATVNLGGTNYPVKTIGFGAFAGDDLTGITLPNTLVSIGDSAFAANPLTSVTIPDSVKTIGEYAFGTNLLNSVDLGTGLTTIEVGGFYNNMLTSVTLPDSLTTLEGNSFGRNKLTNVTFGSGLTAISGGAFEDNMLAHLTLPYDLTFIGIAAFNRNLLTSVTIPAGVTSIGSEAFENNPDLTSVRFLGPAPSVYDTSLAPSFDTASGSLVLSYPPAFGAPGTPGGYTTPTWKGYTTSTSTAAALTGPATASGLVGQSFVYTPTLYGSPAPTVTLSAGTLPTGLSLEAATGKITGTPSVSGAFPITLSASTGSGPAAVLEVTLKVKAPSGISGAAATSGQTGLPFSYTPTITGFPAPKVTITDGALPSGLSLDTATGKITGTPAAGTGGTYPIVLTASNGIGTDANHDVVITINEAPSITGPATASGETGQAFTYSPDVSGSPAPTVSSLGTLPDGLVLNPTTGTITGIPTSFGAFLLTLSAANGVGSAATLDVTITISPAPLTGLAPTITGSAREGQTLTANEGPVTPASTTFTYQWNRYGTPIPGATNKTHRLTAADVGRKLSVSIKATAPGQPLQTLTSPLTGFVSSPNKRLILNTSTVKKGQSFNLIATGLKPKQTYVIWLSGKRSHIGFTDANGMVATSVKFPASTKPGTRRVRVSGYTNGTRTFTVYTHVTYTK